MSKIELLEYLDSHEQLDADEIADMMQMSYSAAAMALVRLVRQDLAARHRDPYSHVYLYELTPKGEARLDYLIEAEIDDE